MFFSNADAASARGFQAIFFRAKPTIPGSPRITMEFAVGSSESPKRNNHRFNLNIPMVEAFLGRNFRAIFTPSPAMRDSTHPLLLSTGNYPQR